MYIWHGRDMHNVLIEIRKVSVKSMRHISRLCECGRLAENFQSACFL